MLRTTPYNISYEGYNLLVKLLEIKVIGFEDNVSIFSKDTSPLVGIKGTYIDKDFLKSCEIVVTVAISTTEGKDTTLKLVGKFVVNKNDAIKIPNISTILSEYCFDIINDYVNDSPLIDKFGNLFPVTKFPYSSAHFESVVFE